MIEKLIQIFKKTSMEPTNTNSLPIFTYKITAIASDHCINIDTIS